MPKMKTNPGAKKRFTLTGTGKIKRKHAYKSRKPTACIQKNKKNAKSNQFCRLKTAKKENNEEDQRILWSQKKCMDSVQERR